MSEVTSAEQPAVVVVGGGYAGVSVAKALDAHAAVTLIEPRDTFVHNVAALRALVDPEWLPRIFFPYDKLLARGQVIRDRVTSFDGQSLGLESGTTVVPDFVVLATGSTYPFPAKSPDTTAASTVTRVRTAHEELARAQRVLLVGAGAVGIELAAEIRLAWPEKKVVLADMSDDVLGPRYSSDLRAELRRQLTDLGVELELGCLLRCLPDIPAGVQGNVRVETTSGREITADLWFRCFGVEPSSDFVAGDFAAARTADGFLEVNDYLQVRGHERVFALGDVSTADAKMAGLGMIQSRVVASNIRALHAGSELKPYRRIDPMIMVPIGRDGGAGEAAGSLLDAAEVASVKGRDLLIEYFSDILGAPPTLVGGA